MARSGASLAAVAFAVVLAACAETTPAPEEVTARLQAACTRTQAVLDDGPRADANDEFTYDSLGEPIMYDAEGYVAISEAKAETRQRELLDALQGHLDEMWSSRVEARTSLELRAWDDAAAQLAASRRAATAADAAAAGAGIPTCGSAAFMGDWLDRAEQYLAQSSAAAQPTGDLITDVTAVCERFGNDIADLPAPLTSVDFQLWVLGIRDALNTMSRDLEALEAPADKTATLEEIFAVIDELQSTLGGLSQSAINPSTDVDVLAADVEADLNELVRLFDQLGVAC